MAENVGNGGGLRLVETWMVSRTQSVTGPHLAPWGAARAPSDTAGDPASTEAGVALFSVGAAVTVRASTPRRRCPNAATAENYKQDKAEGGRFERRGLGAAGAAKGRKYPENQPMFPKHIFRRPIPERP